MGPKIGARELSGDPALRRAHTEGRSGVTADPRSPHTRTDMWDADMSAGT